MKKSHRVWLAVPPEEKDDAINAHPRLDNGQKAIDWDKEARLWFARPGVELNNFDRWLPRPHELSMNADDPVTEFAQKLEEAGLVLRGLPVMDGSLQRVPTKQDKKGSKSGVYKGFMDGRPAGWYRDYRSAEEKPTQWVFSGGNEMDPLARLHLRAHAQQTREDSARALAQQYNRQAGYASSYVSRLPQATNNPYLIRKGVNAAPGVRINPKGELVIPFSNAQGDIRSYQRIPETGGKDARVLKDSEKTGNWFALGTPVNGQPLLFAEGYATAASLHESTGLPVLMTIDAGNMIAVGQNARAVWPDSPFIFCADNDHHLKNSLTGEPENKGILSATRAAELTNGEVIAPAFTPAELEQNLTDFNDMILSRGKDLSRHLINVQLLSMGVETPFNSDPQSRSAFVEGGVVFTPVKETVMDKQEVPANPLTAPTQEDLSQPQRAEEQLSSERADNTVSLENPLPDNSTGEGPKPSQKDTSEPSGTGPVAENIQTEPLAALPLPPETADIGVSKDNAASTEPRLPDSSEPTQLNSNTPETASSGITTTAEQVPSELLLPESNEPAQLNGNAPPTGMAPTDHEVQQPAFEIPPESAYDDMPYIDLSALDQDAGTTMPAELPEIVPGADPRRPTPSEPEAPVITPQPAPVPPEKPQPVPASETAQPELLSSVPPVQKETAAGPGAQPTEETDGIVYGPRRPEPRQREDLDKIIRALTTEEQRDNTVLYRLDGQDAFHDLGNRLEMCNGASQDDRRVLAALAVASKFYGGVIELTGSPEFKQSAMRLIIQHELDIRMKIPAQRTQLDELRKQMATTQDAVVSHMPGPDLNRHTPAEAPAPVMPQATTTATQAPAVPGAHAQVPPPPQMRATGQSTPQPVTEQVPAANVPASTGASSGAADGINVPEMPQEPAPTALAPGQSVTAVLKKFGNAMYENKEQRGNSFFIELQNRGGSYTYWGQDLRKLIENHKVGDVVTLTLNSRDAWHVPGEEKERVKNNWSLEAVSTGIAVAHDRPEQGQQMQSFPVDTFGKLTQQIRQAWPDHMADLKLPPRLEDRLFYLGEDRHAVTAPKGEASIIPPDSAAPTLLTPVMASMDSQTKQLDLLLVQSAGEHLQGVVRLNDTLYPALATPTADNSQLVINAITDTGPRFAGYGQAVNFEPDGATRAAPQLMTFHLKGREEDAPLAARLYTPEKQDDALFQRLGFEQTWKQWDDARKPEGRQEKTLHQEHSHSPGR